ncbi:MAG: phosphoribosylformylglycinamidine cyclo-ligase [Proteobacteria bacterium]|jgi:phosphoribosylformylglycinamidine cyclo-ligase|nr:phosphoribosylformylglycinamidine cyclo-ligase [Pseudomonadota bacterium]MDA1238214.1 phosphoribosylformylglycinamidine cyclo-ligase [Pseudomonadota bacterium]
MVKENKTSLTYADAGVSISTGNQLIESIKPAAMRTKRSGVVDGLGGFGALFDLKNAGYLDPILVAATDGVGTKLLIAIETQNYSAIGIDLVAMCVNDLICQGAEPLFFLDYFATGKLKLESATKIISSIARGCELSGCSLIGGETAEMPGLYKTNDFDLAGFAVGAVERGRVIPKDITSGDSLIGLASNGIHSNGFSLVRKIVELSGLTWDSASPFGNLSLGEDLLIATRLYVKPLLPLLKSNRIKGLAHITGGGITENIVRILPEKLTAEVFLDNWELPGVYSWLSQIGGLEEQELLRTFNAGIGMVAVVDKLNEEEVMSSLTNAGETVFKIGKVCEGTRIEYSGQLLK